MITQIVRVQFLGTTRLYSYMWEGDEPLFLGQRVEVPPNVMQEDGGSGIVVAYGSDYTGPMARIVRKIPEVRDGSE